MMDEISREWWIGYVCAFIGMISAILLAAWLLLSRPEAPPPPPPPMAKVEPPPPPPEFMYPEPPSEPEVREHLRKLEHSLRMVPPCRVETETVTMYFEGGTSGGSHKTVGRILSRGSDRWLIKGEFYRQELHVSHSALHPLHNVPVTRRIAPYDFWEVRNRTVEASVYSGDSLVKAFSLSLLAQERENATLPVAGGLVHGFSSHLSEGRAGGRLTLAWSVHTEPSGDGDLIVIAGDPLPDSPFQHVRCELALDPARDYLVVRESYWMNGELHEEETNELQQLPDGRWFPKRNVYFRGDIAISTDYKDVEMNAEIDDSQFEIESIPCNWETVLVLQQTGQGINDQKYLKFDGTYWRPTERPRQAITSAKGKIEMARPKE